MIVSFRHDFVYVAIPRTATQSMREALRPHLGPRDWEQCLLFARKRFPVAPLAALRHGHLTCQDVEPYLLPNFWRHAFKFATVRDPFDRFLSACRFAYRGTDEMQRDPLGAMKRVIQEGYPDRHILFRPQHHFVTGSHGELLVDYLVRFESLHRGYEQVCARLSLAPWLLSHRNGSEGDCTYDEELEALVRDTYRADFTLFNYPAHLQELAACS